jgi:hypothetical protein
MNWHNRVAHGRFKAQSQFDNKQQRDKPAALNTVLQQKKASRDQLYNVNLSNILRARGAETVHFVAFCCTALHSARLSDQLD